MPISLLHVDEIGQTGLADLAAVTDLPILLDDEVALVWQSWAVTWRDVYVLDAANEVVTVYNLTEHDLADPKNYAELYEILVAAAGG